MTDVNLTTADGGELPEVGPTRIRILEDGSRTDNRIGAIASMMPAGVSGPSAAPPPYARRDFSHHQRHSPVHPW